ncbi:malto-oligosyltrehalose synthase [Nocardiopsis metallicus]|uniref:(1->4)-alpha-D-glucan 1-alpha-D-glucosylmutase n=1 Tax=Nocardiopsis metallicus TaxID=179819 RepID=A0A840W201_9ACTN|nr:malto-oligosyltrehalose synthase [Nocardiopsis metallicus]MBB5490092.1 (1->4)-alpha-D-glucan 1-alpha-D-glucosylmutase [Nocardiopsis metallicus]
MSAHTISANGPQPPTSTYRLQLRPGFGLAEAADLLDHLHRLGVGAVYLSPILTATPGSDHGYDVADPTRVSEALGGERAHADLAARAHALGMGVVVDIVPNHMSVARPDANPWWWDVLEHGRDSVYARCFDVDFDSGPVLVPVLGDDGDDGRAALGELTLADGHLVYFDKRFPLAPGTFTPGDSAAQVHERQHYRLVSWRRGDSQLNYRRFFDVDHLAAVRVEEPGVFDAAHAEILRWAEEGRADGLRVDHVDGLSDPGGYLRRLAERFPGWIVVEKILAPGETLPASWPVAGTTGYDALRTVCGVFVDPDAEPVLTALAREHGVPTDIAAVDHQARSHAANELLRAEVRRIAALLPASEHTEEAVAELLASFDVYRSYLPEAEPAWARAVRTAAERRPDLEATLKTLDRTVREDPHGELARRVQQTSGMVVAMGTENTAFYRNTRYTALNEVGGDPAEFGVGVSAFHEANLHREAAEPHTMTALSTHDTKRSEDVRARLAVLSEIPGDFADAVRRWSARVPLPEPSLDLLGWQTLLGAWPISDERLVEYLLKAAREARLGTSWTAQDPDFEDRIRAWPGQLRADADLYAEIRAVAESLDRPGWSNSLGQKAVQLLGPGVPDVYQGTELWDLSLVDPDNRRPVDHGRRAELLDRIERGWRPPVDASGAAKLHLVRTCLRARAELRPSGYLPLAAEGAGAEHALAFARTARGSREPALAVVATRLPVTLADAGGWGETVLPLPPGEWTDRLTGRTLAPERMDGLVTAHLAELLDRYPVAVLVRR